MSARDFSAGPSRKAFKNAQTLLPPLPPAVYSQYLAEKVAEEKRKREEETLAWEKKHFKTKQVKEVLRLKSEGRTDLQIALTLFQPHSWVSQITSGKVRKDLTCPPTTEQPPPPDPGRIAEESKARNTTGDGNGKGQSGSTLPNVGVVGPGNM